MKKLMIALSATAMFSLCANAGIPEGAFSGTDFTGAATGKLNVQLDDTNSQQGTGVSFWSSAAAPEEGEGAGLVESEIVAGEAGSANEGNYLKVDETAVLNRLVGRTGDGIPVAKPMKSTEQGASYDGIAISARVQFTAADEAPQPETGDKILVWLKQFDEKAAVGVEGEEGYVPAEAARVALMVTDKNDAHETDAKVNTTDWYNLTIKAVATGSGLTASSSFTVEIDGTPVTVNGKAVTFDSMVTGGSEAQTIASVGFKGTGCVDDIGFSTFKAEAIPTVAISGSVSGYDEEAEYDVLFQDAEGEDVEDPKVGDTFIVVVTGAQATDTVTCDGVTFAWDGVDLWKAEYTVTAADGAAGTKVFAVTVTQGSGPAPIKPDVSGVPETVTLAGLNASYKAGDTIDPTQITGSTSKNGYTVKVTVKVGKDAITEATVLKAGDTVTVTAEEVATTYTITYTYVDAEGIAVADVTNENVTEFTVESEAITIDTDKISKTGYTVTSVTPATIAAGTYENQTVTVVLTAIPTYTVTAAEVTGATVTFSTEEAVVSGTTVTFTVEVTDDTKEIDTVTDGTNTLTADAETGVYSVTVADANIVITVTLKAKQGGETLPTYLECASEKAIAAYKTWAEANGVDTDSQYEEAYLLNCAPTAVETEKAAFKLTIAMVDGEAVVTAPEGKNYNGVVVIKSYKDVTCKEEGVGQNAAFYKATLEVEKAATK